MNIAIASTVIIFALFVIAIAYVIYKHSDNRMVWEEDYNDGESKFEEIDRLIEENERLHSERTAKQQQQE